MFTVALIEWRPLPWPAIGLGLALGAGVVVVLRARKTGIPRRAIVADALGALGALARCVAPLAIPVAVVLAFASRQFHPGLQLLAGIALGSVFLIVALDEEGVSAWLSGLKSVATSAKSLKDRFLRIPRPSPAPVPRDPPDSGTVLRFVVLTAIAVAVPTWGGVHSGWTDWDTFAGKSGAFVWISLELLWMAAVLRLFAYATTTVRWLIVVGISVTGFCVGLVSGIWPGKDGLARSGAIIFAVVAVVSVLKLIQLVARRPSINRRKPARSGTPAKRFAGSLGSALGLLSAVFLAVGIGRAALETTPGAQPIGRMTTVTDAPNLDGLPGNTATRLAWAFAPLLRLHDEEDDFPISASDYVGRTDSGCHGPTPPECSPKICTTCGSELDKGKPGASEPHGVFYARVVDRKSEPRIFAGWNPEGRRLHRLIQYWIFYAYNRWSAKTVLGSIVQEHEADWEFVSIGLDPENKPLFLALSAHCGGQVVRWTPGIPAAPGRVDGNNVVIEPRLPAPGEQATHPIVAVAKGSHANYSDDGGRRSPDWSSCKRIPSEALATLVYASNVRDLTSSAAGGEYAYPAKVVVVTASSYPLSVKGAWGTEWVTFGRRRFGPMRGPLSPPQQGRSWNQPVALFFCDRFWHPYERGTREQCRSWDRPFA